MARGGNPPLPHSAFCCVPASHNGPHYANGCQQVRKMRKVPHFSAISRRAPPAQNRLSGAHSAADGSAPAHQQHQRQLNGASPSRRHRLNSEPPNDASTEITSPQRQPLHSRGHWWRRPLSKTPAPPANEQHAVPKALGIRIKQRQQAFALLTRSSAITNSSGARLQYQHGPKSQRQPQRAVLVVIVREKRGENGFNDRSLPTE